MSIGAICKRNVAVAPKGKSIVLLAEELAQLVQLMNREEQIERRYRV